MNTHTHTPRFKSTNLLSLQDHPTYLLSVWPSQCWTPSLPWPVEYNGMMHKARGLHVTVAATPSVYLYTCTCTCRRAWAGTGMASLHFRDQLYNTMLCKLVQQSRKRYTYIYVVCLFNAHTSFRHNLQAHACCMLYTHTGIGTQGQI